MTTVTRQECGWPAHYCCATRCVFHRTTILSCGENYVVVSTVGRFVPSPIEGAAEPIGAGYFYETGVFRGYRSGPYVEAATTEKIPFRSTRSITSNPDHHPTADFEANTMHEAVVEEISAKLLAGMEAPLCDMHDCAAVDD